MTSTIRPLINVALIPSQIYFDFFFFAFLHIIQGIYGLCASHNIQRKKEMFLKPELYLSLGERVAVHWSTACEGKFFSITEQQCVGLVSGR